jgi:hypothetical protein
MTTHAMIAQFSSPATLMDAAKKVRDAGYSRFDCHSPFPIHGMDDAMGLGRSPVGFIVGGMAALGAAVGFSLQTWVATAAYPLVISGKPLFSWQAFIIITFALFVLFGAFGAVFGMLRLNKLPRFHHPLFYSDMLGKASDDAFLVSIDAQDPKFDEAATRAFLESLGAQSIEIVRGDA